MKNINKQEYFMNIAIKEALKSKKKNEVPVGAIIVKNNKIISKAHNLVEKKNNSIYHAELIAIKKASKKIKNWRLDGCTIYITMEPCMMCCGAISQSRIKKIVYGVENQQFGHTQYLKNIEIIKNVNNDKCLELIKTFFKNKR